MKMKFTRQTKKIIGIYIAVLLVLYAVVEILPKVTDIFETTQVLEPGNLRLSYETTGYLIKEESVGTASQTGNVEYLVKQGTSVKKGYPIIKIDADNGKKEKQPRFSAYTDRLKGYSGISNDCSAPISGVFSLQIDGYEDYFTPEKMYRIKRETVEDLSYDYAELERNSVIKGEPVYKISCDDVWYILCWVDSKTAETYYEGRNVRLELPEGDVEAEIYSIKKDGDDYRVIFYLDVYYKAFAESRNVEMTIVMSDNEGLLIDNDCMIEKDGQLGVYVVNKNDEFIFTPVKVIAADKKQSVIEDVTFYDDEGYQVYTVDVYDEVLRHPKSALEKDLHDNQED